MINERSMSHYVEINEPYMATATEEKEMAEKKMKDEREKEKMEADNKKKAEEKSTASK